MPHVFHGTLTIAFIKNKRKKYLIQEIRLLDPRPKPTMQFLCDLGQVVGPSLLYQFYFKLYGMVLTYDYQLLETLFSKKWSLILLLLNVLG